VGEAGRGWKAVDGDVLGRGLVDVSIQPELRYSASVCSAATRTTSKRIAWSPRSRAVDAGYAVERLFHRTVTT
jgi:hypothetical protein